MKHRPLLVFLLFLGSYLFSSAYTYRISWDQPQSHVYQIQLEFLVEDQPFSDLQIAAWRPGKYQAQDYAAFLFAFEVRDERSQKLSWKKIDKNTWRVFHPHSQRVRVSYQQKATTFDPGASYLSSQQAYLYPLSSLLYLKGRLDEAIHLSFPKLPLEWEFATPLNAGAQRGTWYADDFYELAESPLLMSPKIRRLAFELEGVAFSLHFQGEYLGNPAIEEKLIEGFRAIAQQHYALFKRFPFKRYAFIFRLSPLNRWHGLEQSQASTYLLPIQVLRNREQLYLLAAHELFHAWNVKRIRPAVMTPYAYEQLPFSRLLWFSEGLTDYYALLICVRAGLISESTFRTQLAALISTLDAFPKSHNSPAQYSFNASLSTQAGFEEPPFYNLGKQLGLLIDLKLRNSSEHRLSLDAFFQRLNPSKPKSIRGIEEEELESLLADMQPSGWDDFFQKHVYAQKEIDYTEYFAPMGLKLESQALPLEGWERLGISESQYVGQGLQVMKVTPGSPAAKAGIRAGYLILSLGDKGMSFFRQAPDHLEKYLQKPLSLSVFNGVEIENILIKAPHSYRLLHYSLNQNPQADSAQQQAYQQWISPLQP